MGHVSMEVAKTVMEVADVAFAAVEHCHHLHQHETAPLPPDIKERGDFDVESLRSENIRIRQLLEENLNLLRHISSSPTLLHDCPSDLHDRILSAVNSESFLNDLDSLRQKSTRSLPSNGPSGEDMEKDEVLINNADNEEPSRWVWVPEEMVPKEEKSGIDGENYLVVSEEHVVDGVATFMARCILANPKSLDLSPLELQKALMKTLGGMNKVEKMLNIWHAGKMFYTLATWGLCLASLYQGRAILKLATMGVHHSSKMALKVL